MALKLSKTLLREDLSELACDYWRIESFQHHKKPGKPEYIAFQLELWYTEAHRNIAGNQPLRVFNFKVPAEDIDVADLTAEGQNHFTELYKWIKANLDNFDQAVDV